jgi:O-acetyl-ADP-ribose deacetylase (regulator of RNase III)
LTENHRWPSRGSGRGSDDVLEGALRRSGFSGRLRHWRFAQGERSWQKRLAELKAATGEDRMRVQVCPRGCSYQLGRRDLVTRTRLSGKADIRVEYAFETSNCPKCGTIFQRECGRCQRPIFVPVSDRCEFCGLLQPWASERRATALRSQPRQWRPVEDSDARPGNPSPAVLLGRPSATTELLAIEGDITSFDIDAVISDDDMDGRMWASVASSIKSVAGADIERDSVSRGPYPLGSAWFTYGGNLPASGIIHVAAMDHKGRSNGLDTIRMCIESGLAEALRRGMQSVALAAIGTWPQNIALGPWPQAIPLETWLEEIPPEIVRILRGVTDRKLAVLLVLFQPDDFKSLTDLLQAAVRSA